MTIPPHPEPEHGGADQPGQATGDQPSGRTATRQSGGRIGLIGGLGAALITAVATVTAAVISQPESPPTCPPTCVAPTPSPAPSTSGPSLSPSPSPSPTPTSPSPSTSTSGPSPSPQLRAAALRYTATVTDSSSRSGLDLDDLSTTGKHLTADSWLVDLFVRDSDGTFGFTPSDSGGSVVDLTTQREPGKSDCLAELGPLGGDNYEVRDIRSGATPWLCVRTSEKRVAAIHIRTLTHAGGGQPVRADVDVILWTD